MRVVDGFFLALVIGGAAYVYDVKHEAEQAHDTRRDLERSITLLNEDVSLLEADLAALEKPARIAAIVSAMPDVFALEPISSEHYVRLSDLPFRSELVEQATGSISAEDDTGDDGSPVDLEVQPASPIDGLLADILEREQAASPDEPLRAAAEMPPGERPSLIVAPPAASDGIGDLLERMQ